MALRPFPRTDTYHFANPHQGTVELTVIGDSLGPGQFDKIMDAGSMHFRTKLRPRMQQLTVKGAYDCDRMPSAATRTLIIQKRHRGAPRFIATVTMRVTLQAIVDEDQLGKLIEMTLQLVQLDFGSEGYVLDASPRPPKPVPAKQLAIV